MKTEVIKLSEFIELLKDSEAKRPKVPNYEKIRFMIGELTRSLYTNGDVDIPINELQKYLI